MQPKDPANCCDPRPWAANALHPDQHALVVNPNNPTQVFEGSDGGVMRSSGAFADQSSDCDSRPLGPISMAKCHELLSRVPTTWTSLNAGLSTLQFQSLSVNPQDNRQVMGGTQDNGTFQGVGDGVTWPQIIYGDGGQSGWNATSQKTRFNSFFGQFHDANVNGGDPTKWYIIGGPIASSPEGSNFYVPIIADPNPAAANTIYEGSQSVWRTQDWGGDPTLLKANCPEFFVSGADPSCGDFVRIGSPSDLTANAYGSGRRLCCVSWIARTPVDTGTIWAATNGGRVFVTHNSDAADPTAVSWTRIDSLNANPATNDPQRSITSIAIDPNNVNHAWISYTGYNFNTPAEPGHVFSVTYDPIAQKATWTNLDGDSLADLPVTGLVYDSVRGDLYASTDFGVLALPAMSSTWTLAGSGLPMVEVARPHDRSGRPQAVRGHARHECPGSCACRGAKSRQADRPREGRASGPLSERAWRNGRCRRNAPRGPWRMSSDAPVFPIRPRPASVATNHAARPDDAQHSPIPPRARAEWRSSAAGS